ncbi:hypothetical protein [Arthrobacter sp. PsM3]|uniref:hypothetical protein n=1 Tax=Arthrobacter sp. PsM3 TaxID=3030531 RepID=UPI00263A8535|nr:hypothetical protein [Arthrobacter sp. PsM3]MDN4646378.1 hypothetical protein [Arthrobacter sp. PsM3]
MGELTRFRLIRNLENVCRDGLRVEVPSGGRKSEFASNLARGEGQSDENYAEMLHAAILAAEAQGSFSPDIDSTRRAWRVIENLTNWFQCHRHATFDELVVWLIDLLKLQDFGEVPRGKVFATIVAVGSWQKLLELLEDRLLMRIASVSLDVLKSGNVAVSQIDADGVNTALAELRVASLVEALYKDPQTVTPKSLDDRLTCPVALPCPPFPLLDVPRLAGPPVVADLYVVRDEWSEYVAGEFAFIENVMPGEERERSLRTTNRTQVVTETETTDVRRTRQETYESERTTQAEESSKQTTLEIGVQFKNDLTLKYGAVENNTQIGASLSFSRTDANRRATEIAREAGRRATEETEKIVRELRRETRETTVRELDAHRLSNPTDKGVHGVYRWIERIQRYQLFVYPHRLQLEFYLPEPGKFLRELFDSRLTRTASTAVPPPLFLTEDGTQGGTPVVPEGIKRDDYLRIGAALGVTGLPAPPDAERIVAEALSVSAGERNKEKDSWDDLPFPPVASGTKEITLPDGYQAVAWSASAAAAPELAKWKDYTDWNDTGDGVDQKIGYHSIVGSVTVGASNVLIRNKVMVELPLLPPITVFNTVHVGRTDYRDRWLAENAFWVDKDGAKVTETPFNKPLSGKLSFGATLGGSYSGTLSISLRCVPSEESMARWSSEVYSMFRAAVMARESQIATATILNRGDNEDAVRRNLSPSVRNVLIRQDLKRQILECLLGTRFSGYDDAPDSVDPNKVTRPLPDFDAALQHAALVRFYEQSFEWENLMHVLYPSYWASSQNWNRAVSLDSSDLELVEFLEAGGARVLVPARPGFEAAVYSFLETGMIIPGGTLCGGASDSSMSVAEEIMAMTKPPADGIPGESWEAPVPTAMLWLDTGIKFPAKNSNPTLGKK